MALQFGDLPQIDDSRFTLWPADHDAYMHPYKQHIPGFNTEDEMYFEDFENAPVSMPSMQRFMADPYPLTAGLLHAKIPLQYRLERQCEQQWPSVDCLRNVSPDRTSASGNSSYATQNELHSPNMYHPIPYGSPTEYSQTSLPYPSTEHFQESAFMTGTGSFCASISLKDIEYEPLPEPVSEEIENVDLKQESLCDHELSVKVETTPSFKYADSGIGNSVRDAESVQPIESSEDPASDSDYSPSSRPGGKRRRSSGSNSSGRSIKRRVHVRKDSHVSTSPTLGRPPKKSRGGASAAEASVHFDDRRPFPCPLASYGCNSNFSSKNEWKRHVSTQHIKLSYWRCDLCKPSTDDENTLYHNDFNRKDLFTQHLRRMHAAPKDNHSQHHKDYSVTEANLQEHQTRCLLVLRTPPPQSTCLFCDMTFSGPTSWEDRMEHVGRHLEKDRKNGIDMLDPVSWNTDKQLEQYLLNEGLIVMEKGEWKIGDGKPRRHATVESDDESVES